MDIKELLDKRGIEYAKTNNPYEIKVRCTNPEHNDSSPSMQYNLEKDLFHCWSCGYSGGLIKFLQSIGEYAYIDLSSKQPYKIKKLKDKIAGIKNKDDIKLPEDRRLFTDNFRGIGPEIYKEFKTFTTNQMDLTDYLCIPVYQNNRLKFIEGRFLRDLEEQPRYMRKPSNVNVKDCMFPLDKLKNTNYVILVEGIFDMLNMWRIGYNNTLCIFGSTNFSKTKVDILDNLGVTKVDIMMDSDKSGIKASEKISELLDKSNIYSRIILLPPGIDPGELTKETAERILR